MAMWQVFRGNLRTHPFSEPGAGSENTIDLRPALHLTRKLQQHPFPPENAASNHHLAGAKQSISDFRNSGFCNPIAGLKTR
jgi:hypothetical protein